MVQVYADVVENNLGWSVPANILGVADSLCAYTATSPPNNIDVSFPAFGFVNAPSTVDVYVKGATRLDVEQVWIYVWDGVAWHYQGWFKLPLDIAQCAGSDWFHISVGVIDTAAKLDLMQVRCEYRPEGGGGGGAELPREAWTAYVDAVSVIAVEGAAGTESKLLIIKDP